MVIYQNKFLHKNIALKFGFTMVKVWYYGKKYGTMKKKTLLYYTENYATLEKTMVL